jgi:carboxyl-terminal processing protease
MTKEYEYVGDELELFENVKNWKKYVSELIHAVVKDSKLVVEIGSGIGANAPYLLAISDDYIGIEPDEKVTEKGYAPISYTLVAGNHVFDFATTYFYKHPSLSSPSTFQVSEQEYEDFKKFLVGKSYDYTTYTEKSVKDMEAYLAKEPYFDEIKEQLDQIKAKVNHSKENDLETHKKEIKKILSEEIISRYYFQEGMIEASLQGDPVIDLAKSYFATPARLAKALAGTSK